MGFKKIAKYACLAVIVIAVVGTYVMLSIFVLLGQYDYDNLTFIMKPLLQKYINYEEHQKRKWDKELHLSGGKVIFDETYVGDYVSSELEVGSYLRIKPGVKIEGVELDRADLLVLVQLLPNDELKLNLSSSHNKFHIVNKMNFKAADFEKIPEYTLNLDGTITSNGFRSLRHKVAWTDIYSGYAWADMSNYPNARFEIKLWNKGGAKHMELKNSQYVKNLTKT